MTPAEFKRKWARYSGKETSAYQEHFNDLCALLGQPSPAAADPTGSESFCFQKRVVKDAELFAFHESNRIAEQPETERGFADVWKRGCFAWEYKGKRKISTKPTVSFCAIANRFSIRRCSSSAISIATSFARTLTARCRKHTSSPMPTSTTRKSCIFCVLFSPIPNFLSRSALRTKSPKNLRNRLVK